MKSLAGSRALAVTVIGAGTLALVAGAGSAATAAKPKNTSAPTISGTPQEGQTLTGNAGTWDNKPTDFNYYWTRCDKSGNSCANISGATGKTYKLTNADVGNTIRLKVRAKNGDGISWATSVPTGVVTAATAPPPAPAANGCPSGTGAIQVNAISAPARLTIDQQQTSPAVVTGGTQQLVARYHVTACGSRPVQGALVYATAIPFNQLNVPAEQPTGADGWAEIDFRMLGFPVSSKQGLIAIFVRARKPGEDLLGGISTRRLFSVPVHLH
jgi:hypothetical protein